MNKIQKSGVDISVNVNGRPVRLYSHEGKVFLESRVGTEYSITIKNNNSFRVEVVAAVDGLSVLTGNPASIEDSGYVINAWGEYTIKGFRKDNDVVGAFKFVEKQASYAAGKGQASNTGVLAIAVYKEKTYQPQYSNHLPLVKGRNWHDNFPIGTPTCVPTLFSCSIEKSCSASDMNMHADSVPVMGGVLRGASYDHGTTWGSSVTDRVTTTTFERDYLLFVQEIFYNSREKLDEMGVKLVHEAVINTPSGFPKSFATPPAGWP